VWDLGQAVALLKRCAFSRDLAQEEIEQLARAMMWNDFEDGEVVIRQGDEGGSFYLLAGGRVEAYVRQPDGSESLVKVYDRPGSYFGELALLLNSGTRRATVRAKGKTTLLSLTRADFDNTLKPLRESLLRSAAVRPADKALRWAQALEDARPLAAFERQFGLGGEQRQQLLLLVFYLALGTAFYTWNGFEEFEKTTPAAGFYYAVEAGLAVGFGVLHPRGEGASFFTSAFVLGEAALVANAFSSIEADFMEGSRAFMPGSKSAAKLMAEEVVQTVAPLVSWWALGLAFGHLHEGLGWGDAVLFAVSATSSVGLQGVRSLDDGSLLFCALYCLIGVPLYLATFGRLSLFAAREVLRARRATIRRRAAGVVKACDEEVLADLFAVFDADQSGIISPEEVPRVIRFLATNEDLEVTSEDIDFLLEEFGSSPSGITRGQFIQGLRRWSSTVDGEPALLGLA